MHPDYLLRRPRPSARRSAATASLAVLAMLIFGGDASAAAPTADAIGASSCEITWYETLLTREVLTNPCGLTTQPLVTCRPLFGGPDYVKIGKPKTGTGQAHAVCDWFDTEVGFNVVPGTKVPPPTYW